MIAPILGAQVKSHIRKNVALIIVHTTLTKKFNR